MKILKAHTGHQESTPGSEPLCSLLGWRGVGCLGLRQSPAPDARRLQLRSMGLPSFSQGSVRPSPGDIVSHPKTLASVGSAKIGGAKEFLVPCKVQRGGSFQCVANSK